MTRLLYHRLLVILLAAIVVFGGWFAADWQLRQAEAAANWHEQTQVLILDAGHGGEDGGAVAPDGTVEADINLEIALRARAIAELTGVRVIMTRESAQIAYPDDAATVAQRKKADQHPSELLSGQKAIRRAGAVRGEPRKRHARDTNA